MKKPPKIKGYADGGEPQYPKNKKPYDFSKSKEVSGKTEADLLKEGYEKVVDPSGKVYYGKQSQSQEPPAIKKSSTTPKPIQQVAQQAQVPQIKKAPPVVKSKPAPPKENYSQELVHLPNGVETVTPSVKMPLDVEADKQKQLLSHLSTGPYNTYQYPDWKSGAGWGKPITRYFDKATGKEIDSDVSSSYKNGEYNPRFIEGSMVNQGENTGSVKLTAPGLNKDSVDEQLKNTKNPIRNELVPKEFSGQPGLIDKKDQKIGIGLRPSNEFSEGGGINIPKSHEGMFTEKAREMGMSVQEAAAHILANSDKYDPHTVKMANFAHNASKWDHKANGGYIKVPKGFKKSC